MPRRRVAEKRETLPDPVYHNRLVAKFVNAMMRAGKKSLSEGIFYQSMGIIEARMKTDALAVFKQAVDNVKPMLQVKSRRVGGGNLSGPGGGPVRTSALHGVPVAAHLRATTPGIDHGGASGWRVDRSSQQSRGGG